MKPLEKRFALAFLATVALFISGCLVSSKQVAINLDLTQELPPESAIAWLETMANGVTERPCRFSSNGIAAPANAGRPIVFSSWTSSRESLLNSKGYKASYYDLFQVVDNVHAWIHIRPQGNPDRASECTVFKRVHHKFTQNQFNQLQSDFEKTLTALIALGVQIER